MTSSEKTNASGNSQIDRGEPIRIGSVWSVLYRRRCKFVVDLLDIGDFNTQYGNTGVLRVGHSGSDRCGEIAGVAVVDDDAWATFALC